MTGSNTETMKKNMVKGLVALLIVIPLCYLVWVRFPQVENPKFLSDASLMADAHFEKLRTDAGQEQDNGFLDPVMQEYWGFKDGHYKTGSEAEKIVAGWQKYSNVAGIEKTDHKALSASHDADYLRARADYQKLYSEHIAVDLAKRNFVAPVKEYTAETLLPNVIALRNIGLDNVGLAESLMAEGKTKAAKDLLEDNFRFAQKLEYESPFLVNELIALSINNSTIEGGFLLFGPETKAAPAVWRGLSEAAIFTLPQSENLETVLKQELVLTSREYVAVNPQVLSELDGGAGKMARLPGMLRREHNIFVNRYVDLLKAGENVNALEKIEARISEGGLGAYLKGETSPMCAVTLPHLSRLWRQQLTTRRLQLLFGVYCAVREYKAENGKWPETLDKLFEQGQQKPHDVDAIAYAVKDSKIEMSVGILKEYEPVASCLKVTNRTVTIVF